MPRALWLAWWAVGGVLMAWWLLLLLIGPLTGMSFIAAVNTYAEVSAAAGETLTPLSGIWAPTGSACELVAVFLLPFVVIRISSRFVSPSCFLSSMSPRNLSVISSCCTCCWSFWICCCPAMWKSP